MRILTLTMTVAIGLGMTSPCVAMVGAEQKSDRVVVTIDGKPFTEYLTKAGHGPALYPVIGPTGKPITRSYPFTAPHNNGTNDHPHHQSLWMNHGDVNGIDFWGTNKSDDKGDAGPHIAHREFVTVSGGETAEVVTRNDWMNGAKRICADERTLAFGIDPDGSRWIDFDVTIKATDGDVTFGDTKEGSFAIRVVDSMRVDAKTGGHITSSEGQANGDAWGQPARWVDYSGPLENEIVGITLMSHPKSFRPKPRWHVRTYGLFAANPFGQKDFPHPEAAEQGEVRLKQGDALTLKYRVWLHRGGADEKLIEGAFGEFARK